MRGRPRRGAGAAKWALCFAFGLLDNGVAAEPLDPAPVGDGLPRVEIARSDLVPRIDGRLDDPVWELAAPLGGLVQVEPEEGATPSEATDVRVVTDGDTLYVAARCFDSDPSAIVALRLTRDAVLGQDDVINVLISPFHDRRTGYLFQVNAAGARRDALVEDQRQSLEWDGIWQARARIDAQGWTAEFAIPFKTLSFDPDAETWGLNIQRNIRRKGEIVRWASPLRARLFLHLLEAGELAGMVDLRQGKGLDIVPGSTLRFDDDASDSGSDRFGFDPTLDVFYKPTPRVTGVVTVNTDFGETEVDAFQINLSRFPLFFPERRDFFQQDVGIFDFGGLIAGENGRPFFSRRIGRDPNGNPIDLIAGAKVTGRVGRVSFGILDTQVESFRLPIDDDPAFPGRDNLTDRIRSKNLGVARMTVDVLDESRVGAIVTNGDPASDDDNTLVGVDALLRTSRLFGDQQLQQRLWIQHSESSGVDDRQLAWGTRLAYPNDAVSWAAEYSELQENYRPALGRAPRPGTRQYQGNLRLRHRPDASSDVRFVETQAFANYFTDRSDRLQTRDIDVLVAAENRIGDRIELRYSHRFDRVGVGGFQIANGVQIPKGSYAWDGASLILTASPSRRVSGQFVVAGGNFYDGYRYDVIPSIEIRPNKNWLFSLSARNVEVRLPRLPGQPERNFSARTASARVTWHFDADLSWSTLVQWRNNTDRIGIQSRLQWIIVPGREFFFVVTQDLLDIDRNVRRGQTLAVAKLGWTFRY